MIQVGFAGRSLYDDVSKYLWGKGKDTENMKDLMLL